MQSTGLTKLLNHRMWDPLVFTFITLLALSYGQSSVFYVIYFFWWTEVLETIIDWLYAKRGLKAKASSASMSFVWILFMLFYLLFILIVFIGFVTAWGNDKMLAFNMSVLGMSNIFFNVNLLFVILRRIYLHQKMPNIKPTSMRMGVLHISIVLGGMMIILAKNKIPHLHTSDSMWVEILAILPFLFINLMGALFSSNKSTDDRLPY